MVIFEKTKFVNGLFWKKKKKIKMVIFKNNFLIYGYIYSKYTF